MIRMFARHDVADFARWREQYDAFDTERRGLGVVAEAVYPSADNETDVTVSHDFATLEAAKAFVASERLREIMARAGVAGQPTVWFTKLG